MGLIQNLLHKVSGNRKEFKEKFKQAEEEMKINKMLEERQKSSNRRELERYYKDKEEKEIKEALEKIHKKQNAENWKSPHTIIGNKTTILKDDRPILMEKNIFLDNKTKIPISGGRMFFKW